MFFLALKKYSYFSKQSNFLILLSFFIVAFGQPAWAPTFGLLASFCGYAIFWKALLSIPHPSGKFWVGFFWFASIQLVQLSWLISHPFFYIYPLYLFFAGLLGCQFGILCLFIYPDILHSYRKILGLAGLWTLMEWSRLFFLSGYTWNPVGLALTGSVYPLQTASLWGVYGLSFWVMFVNLLFLRAWIFHFSAKALSILCLIAFFPYIYGFGHLRFHQENISSYSKDASLSAVLVQTAFPIEENIHFKTMDQAIEYVHEEWIKILNILKKQEGKQLHLIALPEYVVPYGTYFPIFNYERVKDSFAETFGKKALEKLPPLQEPMAKQVSTPLGEKWFVSNSYWLQALANLFQCDLVAGLQDGEWISEEEYTSYSAAFFFQPGGTHGQRYEKRILVPMGEYIPFLFLKKIAASYGISSSFTSGKEPKIFQGCKAPFGVSICYEETFGDLMRENRVNGAEVLVNLTSDVWYPNSRLPKQHFDHAKLRSVESGIPLIRACNTGVTSAIDSLGNVVKTLGDDPFSSEWVADSLHVEVPTYHYRTFYSLYGDRPIIAFSMLSFAFLLPFRRKQKN